jgi:trypsin-like peptidase
MTKYCRFFLVACVASHAFCQDKRLIVSEEFLPTLSQTKAVTVHSPSTYPTTSTLKWFTEIDHDTDTKFLRLHFRINQMPANSNWKIRILDENDLETQILMPKDFSPPSQHLAAWSRRIAGKSALVELLATGTIEGLEVSIDRYNYQVSVPLEQAYIGQDEREDLVLDYGRDHKFYKWGVPVAMILFVSADTNKDSGCTAFLISKDLLMTNQHCVSESWQLPTVKVYFGYESNPQKIEEFAVSELVAQSPCLDYALLRLDRPAEGWGMVSIDDSKRRDKDQKLVLIQNAPTERKKIAVHKCKVQFVEAKGVSGELTDFYHLCDSNFGSSGSPVMDLISGKVVGLHHAGKYDLASSDYHNLGVRIELILADIASQRPDACKQIAGCSSK